LTWFRHERGIEWVAGFGDDPATQQLVLEKLQTSHKFL
jgi:hypothetical protein